MCLLIFRKSNGSAYDENWCARKKKKKKKKIAMAGIKFLVKCGVWCGVDRNGSLQRESTKHHMINVRNIWGRFILLS
jgi:hypothetical protein